MINRIREIRQHKGLTLADVAAACAPPTTAQTIGRLETGMRNLSLDWMNRIAAALEVEPSLLLDRSERPRAKIIAMLGHDGPRAAIDSGEPLLPTQLAADAPLLVIDVHSEHGSYHAGDRIWLHQHDAQEAMRWLNRDVLVPLPTGDFAFGRLAAASPLTVLPHCKGHPPIIVEQPKWLAVAEMLVRKL